MTLLNEPSKVALIVLEETIIEEVDVKVIEDIAARNFNIARAYN